MFEYAFSSILLFISDTYTKARKACIKAEEDSAIDTAAGETDLDKPRKRHKPARYEESHSSESSDDNSNDEKVFKTVNIINKVLINNKKQPSSSQDGKLNIIQVMCLY